MIEMDVLSEEILFCLNFSASEAIQFFLLITIIKQISQFAFILDYLDVILYKLAEKFEAISYFQVSYSYF